MAPSRPLIIMPSSSFGVIGGRKISYFTYEFGRFEMAAVRNFSESTHAVLTTKLSNLALKKSETVSGFITFSYYIGAKHSIFFLVIKLDFKNVKF